MSDEEQAMNAMRYICGFPKASTSIKVCAVNYWLEHYSDTVFVQGRLRRVRFTMVTPETYSITTEQIHEGKNVSSN